MQPGEMAGGGCGWRLTALSTDYGVLYVMYVRGILWVTGLAGQVNHKAKLAQPSNMTRVIIPIHIYLIVLYLLRRLSDLQLRQQRNKRMLL